MSEYPKYEKVDEKTIRIISIRPDEVPVQKLLETKITLLEKKAQIEQTLANIDEILDNAEQLGININEIEQNSASIKKEN